MRSIARLLAALCCLAPAKVTGQDAAPTIVTVNARATELLEAAIRAHGGPEAIAQVERIHVRMEGRDLHRHQSRRIATPYDTTPRVVDYFMDLTREQIVSQTTSGYPGGFLYTNRFVSDSARHWQVDVRNGTHASRQYPIASTQYGNHFQVPAGYLRVARDLGPANQRRYLGRLRLTSGAEVEAISIFYPTSTITLGFDPVTHLLRAVLTPGLDLIGGDVAVETEFVDYRPVDGVLLPTARLWRSGELIRELRYVSATVGRPVPDTLLAPPRGSTETADPASPDPVRTLGPGVWALRSGGSTNLLVEFRDHLVVLDAAPNVAPEILRRAPTLAGGKPIRYVVPTHHHDDHFGAVRAYASGGTIAITTRGNADYFRRAVAVPRSRFVATHPAPAPEARVEFLEGKRSTLTDGTRTVELHDIGPSPHADEMIVAWLPAEGILFHGDLIESPRGIAQRGNSAETTRHLAEFVRRQGWQVRTYFGVHGVPMGAREFDTLVAMPLLGAR